MSNATAEPPAKTKPGDKPIFRFSDRGVQLSTFANTVETQNGERILYTSTIQRRFKKKDGAWRTTSNFSEDELAILVDLVADARRAIRQSRAQAKAENT